MKNIFYIGFLSGVAKILLDLLSYRILSDTYSSGRSYSSSEAAAASMGNGMAMLAMYIIIYAISTLILYIIGRLAAGKNNYNFRNAGMVLLISVLIFSGYYQFMYGNTTEILIINLGLITFDILVVMILWLYSKINIKN